MTARAFKALVVLLGLAGCGSGEAVIVLEVDLTDFAVPAEVDLIHVELSDDTGAQIGHNFTLDDGDSRPIVDLVRGSRISRTIDLVVYALKGTQRVAASPSEQVSFRKGEIREVAVKINKP